MSSCTTPTARLPAIYVFTNKPLSLDPVPATKVILAADVTYCGCLNQRSVTLTSAPKYLFFFISHVMLATRLPTEILVGIASYLHRQRDILALLLTSRRLYHDLKDSLYKFNCRSRQASALQVVAGQGNAPAVQQFLETLKIECARSSQWSVFEEIDTSDEDTWDYVPERSYFLMNDVENHPLRAAGYRIAHIVHIQNALLAAIRAGHEEIVTTLLDYGAQANFYCQPRRRKSRCGRRRRVPKDPPPLYLAVQLGHEQLVELLLQRGAEPDMYEPCPLYRAVDDERYDLIELLLKHGAIDHESSLKLAALKGNISMLGFLLDNGARGDESGHSALYVATRRENQEMIDLLESKGAKLDLYTGPQGDTWDREDGDGFTPPRDGPVHYEVLCILEDTGIDEEEEEEEREEE